MMETPIEGIDPDLADSHDDDTSLRFAVTDSGVQRLDAFITECLPSQSRNALQRWIKAGQVRVLSHAVLGDTLVDDTQEAAGQGFRLATSSSFKLHQGDVASVRMPEIGLSTALNPIAMSLDIYYEDDHLLIVNKPAGLSVHPTPKSLSQDAARQGVAAGFHSQEPTLVHGLLAHNRLSGVGGELRPGIVHRLDKDTTGLMVVAKTDLAHHRLAEMFAARTITRRYHAFVIGRQHQNRGIWEYPIGRDPSDRKKMAVVAKGGKASLTHFQTLAVWQGVCAMMAFQLQTGRTHQIRVHATHAGFPLVGDRHYGKQRRHRLLDSLLDSGKNLAPEQQEALRTLRHFPRQALHATTLGFEHPVDATPLLFHAPLPADMSSLASLLEIPAPEAQHP
ncbi:MAG: RluA family pseudouridine synthase [Alphaproteobacteria bacterium]|nr:RluA family pseudouridine synthase [Alphaproteobacteria bacterium]